MYVEFFGLDFRCVVDAKIVRSDFGYRCENFECQEIVKRCEYSEDMELKVVVFKLSTQIDTVLYINNSTPWVNNLVLPSSS